MSNSNRTDFAQKMLIRNVFRNAALIGLLFLLPFCTSDARQAGFSDIDPGGLEAFLSEKSDRNVIILDVRTPPEWQNGYVESAELINLQAPNFREQIRELDPDADYLVYCNSGNRSRTASRILLEEGFENVYNYDGSHVQIRREYISLK
ncbi:rhodanese-like domain-containing protein [Natronogracilivirga saccharolytica]|uniref:Rhodanese-like domain-containing protein n=1 Tax=Natronogracilivirga saccharolytica TaxID=2812953 RepID=A0A8J7S922_9BACT|nr:rhodanese-like domain-containing protein [Natronogracilivirga saccharolytica]MBP3192563.1 rhodanese-like domain-containing protein [Natronogracilivirga saccharolytica]